MRFFRLVFYGLNAAFFWCAAANVEGGGPLILSGENGLFRVDGGAGQAGERIDGAAVDAIAFGPGGNLFALTGDRVVEYDGTGYARLRAFIPESSELGNATAMAFGTDGRLYVARQDQLMVFQEGEPDPLAVKTFPDSGISEISGVAESGGKLFLSDGPSGRVLSFDPVSEEWDLFFDRTGNPGRLDFANNGAWAAVDNAERPTLVRVSGQDRRFHGFFEDDLPGEFEADGFQGIAFAEEALFTADADSGHLLRFPLHGNEPASVIEPAGWHQVSDMAVAPQAPEQPVTFAAWRQTHFDETEVEESGAEADGVGDGFANALRFAFGAGREPLPRERLPRQKFVKKNGERFVEIRLVRQRRLAGEGLQIQVSEELGEWESDEGRLAVVDLENLGELEAVTIRDLHPAGENERRFYRATVDVEEGDQ